jgi:hypothetical protein
MFAVEKMTVPHILSTEIGITAVGRHYEATESMTRHMTKSEEKAEGVGGRVTASAPASAKISCISRCDPFIEKLKESCVRLEGETRNCQSSAVLW